MSSWGVLLQTNVVACCYDIAMNDDFFFVNSERELVMDLERLKLTKSVKPKKSRDKVHVIANLFLPTCLIACTRCFSLVCAVSLQMYDLFPDQVGNKIAE